MENLYFEVDFKKYVLELTNYTYRTYYCDFFAEWYLKGSNNGIKYEIIHHQTNYQKPNTSFKTDIFKADRILPFRYFRLIPVGSPFCHDYLAIHRLEFFGTLHKFSYLRKRWKTYNNNINALRIITIQLITLFIKTCDK